MYMEEGEGILDVWGSRKAIQNPFFLFHESKLNISSTNYDRSVAHQSPSIRH